jgi:hypothetical protein
MLARGSVASPSRRSRRWLLPNKATLVAANDNAISYTLKPAFAAKVGDHIKLAVEAENGTNFKIVATAEQFDALKGDLQSILAEGDAKAEATE